MSVLFENSETKENLMRAFAGECQARMRYDFAAEAAKKQNQQAIQKVFLFTAEQEKAHAEIFYNYLKDFTPQNIGVMGGYPVTLTDSVLKLLRYAQHNETQEYNDVYRAFGDKAKEESFDRIAASFYNIAEIERCHAERFGKLADYLENNHLLVSDVECGWMCLNCGHIYTGLQVPQQCPVCQHDRGYFIRMELAPYALSSFTEKENLLKI